MTLIVRRAFNDDCDVVYPWAMDPSTREMSVRQDEFTPEEHRRWWSDRQLPVAFHRWYMLREDADALAWVRYDAVVPGLPAWTGGPMVEHWGGAEVSLVVRPDRRGQGYGTRLLEMTTCMAKAHLETAPLVALILPENTASLRAFEKAGYQKAGGETRLGRALLRYER